jgi:CHAT domain-containing protein
MPRRLTWSWFVLLLACYSATAAGEHALHPGSTRSETLSGSETATYSLDVPAGQAVEVTVTEKHGLAGIVTADSRGGEQVSADLTMRTRAAKRLLLAKGTYGIQIAPPYHADVVRVFDIAISEPHPFTDKDAARISAERGLGEGEKEYHSFTPGYFQRALEEYQASLEWWHKVEDREGEIDALYHVGWMQYNLGETVKAVATARHALEIARRVKDSDSIAHTLTGLCIYETDAGNTANATQDGDEAVDLFRSLGDLDWHATALRCVGVGLLLSGHGDAARSNYQRALAMQREVGDRLGESDTDSFLSHVEFQAGHSKESLEILDEALTIARAENDPVRVAQRLVSMGASLSQTGQIRESIAKLEESLPVLRTLGSAWSPVTIMANLGQSYYNLSQFQRSRDYYEEALKVARRAGIPGFEANVLRGLGQVLGAMGEDDKALELLNQALAIVRKISDRRNQAVTLRYIGEIEQRHQRCARENELYGEALAIDKAGNLERGQAQDLHGMVTAYSCVSNYRQAVDSGVEARDLYERLGDRYELAQVLGELGHAQRLAGMRIEARQSLERSVSLGRETGNPLQLTYALSELAKLDHEEGQLAPAAEEIGEAIDIADGVLRQIPDDRARMEIATSRYWYYEVAIDLEMQLHHTARALEYSERARARGLVNLLREAQVDIRQSVDPALLASERQARETLNAKHNRFERLLGSPHTPQQETAGRKELDDLVRGLDVLEGRIRANSPQYAELMEPQRLNVEQIQSGLLDSESQLLEFWLGKNHSYVWLVSTTDCRAWELPPASEVETLARRAYRAINAHNENVSETAAQMAQRLAAANLDFRSAMRQLGDRLLAPIDGVKVGRLWIVADGTLQYLPFAAMPLPQSSQLLLNRYEVTMLPSASVLAALRAQSKPRRALHGPVAVFADPVFQPNDERVRHTTDGPLARNPAMTRAAEDSGVAAFPRLYFSRQEADAIASFDVGGRVWRAVDFDADRRHVLQRGLEQYSIVHFATHGLLDSRNPELSGIVLSLVGSDGRPIDGFLRLEEIYNLKLNANLVVLSGCQTALGREIRGEGLVGLTRGFLYAGAPRVMASLWSIRDRATAEFMRRFYEALLKEGLAPSDALRRAQLSMSHDPQWKDPYYWAAFILQGER